jgi:hypothetical protein
MAEEEDENSLLMLVFTDDVNGRVTMHSMIMWGAENPYAR